MYTPELFCRHTESETFCAGTPNQIRHKGSASSSLSSGKPLKIVHKTKLCPGAALDSTSPIYFYDRNDPFYEFTNFYPKRIELDGITWPTTEHYFQAQKFIGTPYFDHISRLPRPRDAFDLCRDPIASKWVRGDWHLVKDDVMFKALMAKFSQHDDLKKQLLGTGKRRLVEHTWNDSYWGDGGDGKGRNRLGELLMQVRESLRTAKTGEPSKLATITRKIFRSHSAKRTKDDNYDVEGNRTGRQHQSHTHLASPLVSRRVRSRSVDLGRSISPTSLSRPMFSEVTALSLPRDTNYGVHDYCQVSPTHSYTSSLPSNTTYRAHDYRRVSASSLTNSYTSTLIPTSTSNLSNSRLPKVVTPVPFCSTSSLPQSSYIPKHPNMSSVNYDIITGNHHS